VNTERFKQLLSSKRFRASASVLILVLTVAIFTNFFASHTNYLNTLRHIKPRIVLEILALNAINIIALVYIFKLLVQFCGQKLRLSERFLVVTYSSIANFFTPLQTGPSVKAVYLKTKYKVRFRDYIKASFVYYGVYAFISALFLFGGSLVWWQAALIILALITAGKYLVQFVMSRSKNNEASGFHIHPIVLAKLFLVTFVQICIVMAYYFVELSAVSNHVTLHQAAVYTGGANFALFVSLTPDGIGIREGFLVLSQRLHHISTAVILSANLIDHAVYALFMVLVLILVISLHAKQKIDVKKES
jgi:uncharacterized membrane protein YbhN (UPF0104 family)